MKTHPRQHISDKYITCTVVTSPVYIGSKLLANSEDPDQTPRSAASDLGLQCFPMFQKWDTMCG